MIHNIVSPSDYEKLYGHLYDNMLAFFYDIGINRFVDEFGNIMHNIYEFLTPNQVAVFRDRCESLIFPDISGSILIELIYPEDFYSDRF